MAVRLIHISDLHRGAVGVHQDMAEQIQRQIRSFQPDLVVVSGDLTHRAEPEEFRQVRAFLDGLSFPLFLIPGNHDVPPMNPMTRLFNPFDRYRELINGDLEPVYSSPDVTIASVNTVRSARFHQGRLTGEQLHGLEEVYRSSPSSACRVLVTHHALVGPPGGRIKQPMPNRLQILKKLETLGVNLVLSGHVHEAYCGSSRDFCLAGQRGIVLCQAGLGADRPRPGWAWETNTFNQVEIDYHTITIQVYAYNAESPSFELTGEHRFPRWYLPHA